MEIGHILGLNFNRFWKGDWISGKPIQQRSLAHGEDHLVDTKTKWGIANTETGRQTTNALDAAFMLGVVKNYFSSFLDPDGSNKVIGFFTRILSTVSSLLEGKRDELMYRRVYGVGADQNFESPNEILDQELTLTKLPYIDDCLENKRQELLYGERVVAKLGKLATDAARVKPVAHVVSGLIGEEYRKAVEALLDMPARFYWRTRFFGNSLHYNFITTMWDLITLGTKSIFNSSSREQLYKKTNELGELSKDYFKRKYGSSTNNSRGNLNLYLKMLLDRLGQHWKDFLDPKRALEEKRKLGIIQTSDPIDESYQKLISFTDFTAPFCAGLGLFASTIFDPLKAIWGVFGLEKGKHLINALSTSRKTFQLLNYIPRFILFEWQQGSQYTDLQEDVMNGTASEATKQLYYARKGRFINALLGMVMAVGNVFEPIGHYFRNNFEDNRFLNFLFDTFVKFNDDFFVRFFSKRRECQGRIAFIKAAVKLAQKKDTRELDWSLDRIQKHALNTKTSLSTLDNGILEPMFGNAVNRWIEPIKMNLVDVLPFAIEPPQGKFASTA